MGEPWREAKFELRSAQRALRRMRSAFDSFEDAWRQYLMALRKVWIKAERGCQHVRKRFEPWQGKFKRQQRNDQLLRYLEHARNADEHTIQLILDNIPKQTVTVGGDPVYVGNEIVIVAPRTELRSVKVSGEWYDPTVEHLGKARSHWRSRYPWRSAPDSRAR